MVTTNLDLMTDGNASFLRAARSGNVEKIIEHLKGNIDINTSNANGLNALHLAAKEGHVNVVTELLKRGANVNAATKKGNTALHIASLAGQEEVVRVLIQLGANVNVQSQNGFTPLYMAAQENHDSVVLFLLANGANQSLATEDGFTPLAVALQQGHDKVVAVLLENDTKGRVRLPALHIAAKKDDCNAATLLLQSDHNPDVTSKSGFTPLHIAAHYGNENIAKILLSKGADVNYAAKHQITPLHVASKWGKMNMVTLLLESGAQIESSTRDGLTPLHCAARSGHDQVVDLLLEKGAPFLAKTKNGLAPLHMASQGDHVDSARILLYHKAPVDDVTVDYLTALHVAAHCGHVKVAKLLLDRKADPNARALNGFTPLHIACKKNRIKVVELLLKHGASIEATTESGLTPLHVASFMGCMNIVIYLIQNGANPDVPTVRGETPLHLAARANQTDIIRILLRNGASVDARAREEQTPLHIAARLGNVDIVSLLLQHGAAVDAVTKDMYTALHIAAKEDQEEVASHLLDHGASLTSTTKKGFTPLHLAAKYGNIKVARLLIQKDAPVDAQGKNGVTPLHVAAHYDHVNVALLLLDKGASPHAMAKNGYTPLHIAAKKNQMDIASTLLEYGAKTNSESKAGFTPLHLSSQEGHAEMSNLLIDNKANVNHKANNGLTPLHLCAQDDRVNVATVLMKSGAEVGPQTKAGYTPLHVASHFGQINMVRFLLQNEADVHTTTSHGYTPLHQAAQQGHTLVVNYLLENQASPNVITTQGQTPLSIAQRLGYISVVETLKVVTETTVTTTTTTVTEEKYKVVAPETMQETFMTDSEDEGGADFDEAAIFGKPTHATHVYLPYVEGHNFHMSEEAMLGDQSYGYLTADEMKSLGDDSLPIDVTKDEKHHDLMHSVKQFGAPMVEEDKLSPQHGTPVEGGFSEKFSPDNIDLGQMPIHAGGRLKWKTFLVSFMVDARGGAMRGCRHSGVRVIIPPRKASMPMRITCRYLRKEKLIHPPPLMEGEACASRILEMGPVGARFLGPVIIEVPHFASTRGKEREITILRSDTGETWKEHTLEASEEAVQEVLNESFEGEELSALEDLNTNRITRILTTDFPQYFAVVTRIRQEVHGVGPEGGMVSSTVVPQVQAIFPEGALTKKIRVGLQAQPIAPELVAKLLGNRVAVSPIVTVEPRRRKFHKPITLTIPVPQAATKGMINQYSGDAPTLRLLCSITGSTKSGGSSKAQWEDVTGSTPLTFVNDCVSFTTTVSARFWLMDCRQVNEVTRFATELYQEAVYVPFMSKFVIFAKRYDPYEAQLRVFCMTDDKEDKTLEHQEHFTEVAKSRDVEVLEGKLQYLEFAGNLAPVTKSGEQLKLAFQAFHENRLPFTIRVKDPHIESMGRIAFMKEPKAGRGEPPQIPICNLNVALPEITVTESSGRVLEMVTLEKRYDFIQESGLSKPELIHRADLRLSDIAQGLDKDWILLAQQLDMSESDIDQIKSDSSCEQSEQALMMLRLWLQKSGTKATGNELEKGLRKINREDIIKNCMFNVELVTDDVEKAVAKVHLDQSGFDVFKEELGSSREASMRRGASLDISYDEQDIMKEAESAAETSSETGSLFERDQISQALTDDKEVSHQLVETSNIPADEMDVIFPKCTVTSNGQTNAADSSDTVSGSFPIDVMPNGSSVAVPEDPSAMVHETSSIKIHDFWPAQPCTIVTEVPSSPEGQLSAPSESSTVPSISDQAVTVINQEIVLTDPQNKSIESNRIHVDTTDLGYCSLDKDPNMSPNSPGSDNIIIQQSVPSNLTQNGSQPILEPESKPQQLSSNGIVQQSDTSSLPQQTLEPQPNQELNSIVQQSVTSSLPQEMLEPESKPELSNENLGSETPSTVDLVTVTSTTTNDDSESPLCGKAAQVHQSSSAEIENVVDNVRTPGASLTNDESLVIGSDSNADACAPNLQDAKIRRASKTPPPTPVDELGKDGVDVKIKDNLFSPSSLKEKLKEDGLKETSETEIKSQEIAGRQEIPARLTESETWPSLELDTSQVSISSLPDDEKSEPTTATASDAVMMPTELDKVSTHVENVDPEEEDFSPTRFKDLCSKKVSPTTTSKMLFSSSKLSPSSLLTPDKILPLQDFPLSPVTEVSEIETREMCTSPHSDPGPSLKSKPDQLISTRKGFRSRKRLSPIIDRAPPRVDKGLSPIAVFTPGVRKEESQYFVQTYDAPAMEVGFCSRSTGMSPGSAFTARKVQEDFRKEVPATKSGVEQSTSPFDNAAVGPFPTRQVQSYISSVEQDVPSTISSVEQSTSPFSDMTLDTGVGTDSLDTADVGVSPFIQSPSRESSSTQTVQVEMLSAHTSPTLSSLQDSFCRSDSLDDISKTLGTPSSDTAEAVQIQQVDLPREGSVDVDMNKILVIESFRNVFATEPPFSIVGPRKVPRPQKKTAEDRLFSLHEQLLSEESALDSSTDSGVDLKESGPTDASDTSPLKRVAKRKQRVESILAEQARFDYGQDLSDQKLKEIPESVATKEVSHSLESTALSDKEKTVFEAAEGGFIEKSEDVIDPQRLDDIEKQIIFDDMEFEPTSYKSISSELDASMDQKNDKKLPKGKVLLDSEYITEEVFVKTEVKSRVGEIDLPFDKSEARVEHSKSKSAAKLAQGEKEMASKSSIKTPEYVRQIEEQLLTATSVRQLTSPSSEIDRIYIQDIFVDSSKEMDKSAPSDAKLNGIEKGKSVVEKTIVPKQASFSQSFEQDKTSEIDPEVVTMGATVTAAQSEKEFSTIAVTTEEKTEVDEHGVTTRIIQTVTTTVHSTPETVQLEEGGATLGSEPGSPELSFAEKRDFFQKLSLSSSANTTPTHAAKSSESMRSDTYVAEDAFVPEDGLDSPDEQPSFQECLKFFEKEEQQPVDLPKPVVKDVKKEVWTVLGAGDEDVERERDVETVEVLCETRRESVKDGVAFDSTKDAKVEVVVKTFVPGSEMLEICSVENIDDRDARTTGVQGMEIEALEAGDRSSSVVTTTRTVTSRSGTEIQRPEMEAEGDGSSAVMTEVTTKTVTTVIEKSGDGIEGSGTEGLRADAEEKKTGDGIDVRRTESVSEGLSTGGGVEGKSSTVTEVITRTVRTVVERTGDGDEMEKSESVTETSGLKDDQERKKTEGETDVKRIDSICEKLSTEYVSEDQSSAETEVTTPIFKTVVKRTKDEVGDSELVSHTRELRDDMAKGKTEDGTDAEITEFVSEIRPEDLEDDADEKSSTVTKVLTRTVTTVVKQTGDGTDVEESTVVKRTKDGTDVEESTVVKRTGDGTDVEESTIVKRTKDGTDVEESTVVKRTKDGTEIEESTVVKRTGDGTDVEESTVVKRTKDGTDVEESTIVKRTKDGTDVEESTVVKRTKDGTEVEESTVVKRTGDGTEVEESTVVKRTGDGTEIEKSLPETEDLKEDTYKKKTEERTEYLSEVIPQDEAVTKLSTVTKVVTRTVRTVVKRTGYGTEGEKTESIPETEVKSTEFVPGRPEDLGDEVEDESFRVTKVTTQRTVVERTGDGTEIEGTKFEPKTEELRHDTETEKDGSHVVKTEDIKDAEDKSSMVGTKVTTHTVRAVIKTTEDGSDSVSDIIEGVQDRPFVEMDDGIDIKTTELASEVKARDAEDKSSSVTTTVTTRTVTMTERTGEGSDEIGDGRDVTEVVKQTTRTEEDGTEVSEVIKSEEFRAKSIKTSKEEPEDVTKLVAEVTAKADGKDGSPIGEGKEKHESVTLTEQADDGTRVTETKVFEETEALKDDAEDGASTVITKVTTKTVTVTTTGEGTEFVPDITSKEMSFSKEDMAEIKETEDLGDYDKEKSSSETKIVSDIKTEDKEDDTDKSSIVTSKKTTEAITIAKQDGKEVTETKVAADEKGQELLSDEEFIKKTFRSMIESQPETCQVDVGGDKSTVDAFKKNGSDRSDWQRESPDNMTAVKETMAPSLGKSEIFICTESTLDNVKKILSAADAESNVVIRDGEASTSALESASAETTIEERREEADSKGSETPEKKEPEPEFFFCTKRVSSEVKKILSEVDEANESLLAKGEAPEVEAEPRVATSRIPTTVISTRVLHTTVESTSSMRSDAVEALKLDIERSREVGIQFEEPFARSAGSTEESCFGSSVDIEFVPVLEVSGDITDAPPAAGHEALGTPCSFHHEGELVGEFEKAEVEGPEKVQKGTDEASEGPEKIQRKVEVFEKVHRETARSDEGLEGLERVLKVTDEEDTRKRTMMDKFLDSVTVPPLQRTEEWLDRSSEAMREGVVVEEARAKRSSPTSFDEMARVDTDVVMQLLDLVEVRTEDEAPDIEEDISPSAEEEEEEVEGLMKIEEEPSCETSPSNTVVSRRGVRPQSSLEVEVGSREDEEAREDPIPLSLVEEEMREKMSLVEEEPPVPLSLVKDVREKVSEVVHETKEKVSSVKEEPHAPLSLVKDVREKVSEVVHETKEKVSSVDEESREMSLVEEEVPVPLSLVKDVKEKVSEVVHETKEKVSLVEEEPPAPFSLVKDVREKVSVHETKEKVSLVEEEPPVPLSLVKDVKEKVSEVVHETKEKVSSVKEEPETSSFGKEEQGSRAIEVQGLPISEQPAEVPKLDTETRPLVEETLSSAEAPMESKMATNASESGELETGVSKLPAETECKISVVTKTVEVVTGPETGASQERTKEEHDGDSKFVPCAFDNSAFAGAELIDQVEQSGPVRARSPYEVVRDDVEDVPCVTRQVEMIRRRPLLQNIPSEISEEDLVEREIVSPVSKQSFDLDVAQSFDLEGADVTSQTVTRITTVHPGSFDLEGADMGSRTETSTITTSGSHDLEGDLDVTTVAPGVTTTYRRDEDGTETKTSEHSTTEKVTTDSGYTVTRTVVTRVRQTVGRVPSSDDGSEEVGSDSQNGRSQIGEASVGGMKGDLEGAVPKSISAAMNGPGEVDYHPEYDDFEGDVKGRYGSVSDDVVDSEIRDIIQSSDQLLEDVIERPMTPEPPLDDLSRQGLDPFFDDDEEEHAVSSPVLSPEDPKEAPFAYGMQFEKDEAMDMDSDPYSEEKEHPPVYGYRYDMDEELPCYGDLYTHVEEDEETESRSSVPRNFDVLAGRKFFQSKEADEMSTSSLQEFERLEAEIVRGRKSSVGSVDSLNGGKAAKDDASLGSLNEFERLERECIIEGVDPQAVMQESVTQLSEIEEGHESQASDPLSNERKSSGKEDEEEKKQPPTKARKTASFEDDIDQDSLRDESSLKPDSLMEERREYVDSLKEEEDVDDSLQGDVLRDSLLEDRLDDSLHEMDVLPDESSLSMDGSLKFTRTVAREIIIADLPPRDVMVSSADSLEQMSAFHETSSFTGTVDSAMVSSTDTLGGGGRITFRYEDIPVDELEVLVKDGRRVVVDSEGNVQTEFDVRHFLDTEENFDFAEEGGFKSSSGSGGEEIVTTDEFGNRTVVRKIRKVVTTSTDNYGVEPHSKSSSVLSGSVLTSNVTEPEVEIVTTDEFGNRRIVRRTRKVVTMMDNYVVGDLKDLSTSVEDGGYISKSFADQECTEPEVEEIVTTDEFGNRKIVRKIRQFVTKTDNYVVEPHSKVLSSSGGEFTSGLMEVEGEPEMEEIVTTDEFGNKTIVRKSRKMVTTKSYVTDPHAKMTSGGEFTYKSMETDGEPEVEEIVTTDEFGNQKIVRRIRKIVTMTDDCVTEPPAMKISSSSVDGGKSFAADEGSEPEIEEIVTTDEFGNKKIIRKMKRIVTTRDTYLVGDSKEFSSSVEGSECVSRSEECDDEPEVEEIVTTDEFGNRKIVRKMRNIVTTTGNYASEAPAMKIMSASDEGGRFTPGDDPEMEETVTTDEFVNTKTVRKIRKIITATDPPDEGMAGGFDDEPVVEEIRTTDESGNPRVIRTIRRTVRTTVVGDDQQQQYSSSSSSVEEQMKEFLRREHCGGDGEEEVREERALDENGDLVLVRTVRQEAVSRPEVHFRTFGGPDAERLSREFVEGFRSEPGGEEEFEEEGVDGEGNVVRVTRQVVVRPEVRTVSFTGPDAHWQMEEYMRRAQHHPDTESSHDAVSGTQFVKTTVSSSYPEGSEQVVHSSYSVDDSGKPLESTDQTSSSTQ